MGYQPTNNNTAYNNINFSKIFINNILMYIFIILTGYIHKIVPLCLYVINLIKFGFIFSISISTIGVIKSVTLIVPHGILEIIGFCVAVYIGTNLKKVNNEKETIAIGAVLILVAAIIESYITVLFI